MWCFETLAITYDGLVVFNMAYKMSHITIVSPSENMTIRPDTKIIEIKSPFILSYYFKNNIVGDLVKILLEFNICLTIHHAAQRTHCWHCKPCSIHGTCYCNITVSLRECSTETTLITDT